VNVAQVLALSGVAVACVILFLMMRHPQLRRPQFQNGRRFSIGFSLACALGVFVVYTLMIVWL